MVVLLAIAAMSLGTDQEIRAIHGERLTVYVEGVRNSTGNIGYLVFNSDRGWPDTIAEAVRGDVVPAQKGTTVFEVTDLPPGDYGVLVIHDENGNKKLDRDWKGVPKEQWGMSNNPRVYLAAPSFQRARFHVDRTTEIHIQLK